MVSKYDIRPKEIVLGNPGYPDQREDKVRPLLVISGDIFHQNSGFFVCVGITTNKESDPYLLPLPRNQIKNGQLESDVQVMCKRIATLNHQVIIRKIVEVTDHAYYSYAQKFLRSNLSDGNIF